MAAISDKHECYICGKFCTEKGLKIHLQGHTDNTVYQCDQCGRCLKTKKILKKHKLIHESHYVCSNCYKKFETEEAYNSHSCVTVKVKDRICDTCGKGFFTQYDLNRHIRSHTNETPFYCDICKKGFTQKCNRDLHYRSHTRDRSKPPPEREKKYVCNVCFQAFGWRQHLNRHRKIHSGVKPHVCKICNRGFNQSTHLKVHMLTHSKERPYKCDMCDKSFKTNNNLLIHKKRHGQPSIFCSVCQKGFYTTSCYNTHYRSHTNTKPYTCDICHKSYTILDSLLQHYLKHSKIDITKASIVKKYCGTLTEISNKKGESSVEENTIVEMSEEAESSAEEIIPEEKPLNIIFEGQLIKPMNLQQVSLQETNTFDEVDSIKVEPDSDEEYRDTEDSDS